MTTIEITESSAPRLFFSPKNLGDAQSRSAERQKDQLQMSLPSVQKSDRRGFFVLQPMIHRSLAHFGRCLLLTLLILSPTMAAAITLEYLNAFALPRGTIFEGTRVGGLSGLALRDGLVWSVSDDKGQHGELRVYGFNVQINESKLLVTPQKIVFIRDPKGQFFSKRSFDLEGIIAQEQGFMLSSEGLLDQKPRTMPTLIEVALDGKLKNEVIIPDAYLPERAGKQKKGVRSNGAFEGLTVSPSGNYLWMISEQPLLQDHRKWKQGDAGEVRLLQFKKTEGQWRWERDFLYPLDSVGGPGSASLVVGQGCSEILAVGDSEIIVMERGVATSGTAVDYDVKIYSVSLGKDKSEGGLPLLKKTLVFDFATIKDKIPDGEGLDNFEGLAWGPELKGQRTLLVVSDDNFSSMQRTLWLAFKVR